MSIYGGFATRQQQETYNNYVENLLRNLINRVINFYSEKSVDEGKFLINLKKIHHQMLKMEQHKYLQPKFSYLIEEMLLYLSNEGKNGTPNFFKSNSIVTDNLKQVNSKSFPHKRERHEVSESYFDKVQHRSSENKKINKNGQRKQEEQSEEGKRKIFGNTKKMIDTINVEYESGKQFRIESAKKREMIKFTSKPTSHTKSLTQGKQKSTIDQQNRQIVEPDSIPSFNDGDPLLGQQSRVNYTDEKHRKQSLNRKGNAHAGTAQKYYLRAYKKHKEEMAALFRELSKEYQKK